MATIHPNYNFDPEAAATKLKDSMRGLGTDEGSIIRQLLRHNNEQRQEIKAQFATSYGQEMEDELKSELGGEFEEAVVALITTPRKYDAVQLYNAIKGGGTTESTLVEILITRSNDEIEEIKNIYKEEYDSELVEDVQGDTSGYLKRLLFSQCNANRNSDDEGACYDLAEEEAKEIYEAGEGQLGTDEAAISRIFCTRNWAQLRATFEAYKATSEKDIDEAIKSEASGSLEDAYLAIIEYAKDPATYFAKRAYDSMKGAGTSDTALIRCIVSRSEIDLEEVKTAFQNMYEQSLAQFVEDDCGGDYKRLLLGLVNRGDQQDSD